MTRPILPAHVMRDFAGRAKGKAGEEVSGAAQTSRKGAPARCKTGRRTTPETTLHLPPLELGRHEHERERLWPARRPRNGEPGLRGGKRAKRRLERDIGRCRSDDARGELIGNVDALREACGPGRAAVIEALWRGRPP